MKQALLGMASLLVTLATTAPVWAQSPAEGFPSRTVTIVIPFAPGATGESEARLYSQKLSESLGKPFVIDFKPGAGAVAGTSHVSKAAPDGHTLLSASQGYAIVPAFYATPPYDPVRDFAPIALMSKRPTMLMAHPSLPVNSLQEYLAYAKNNPGRINFATTGAGGAYHIAGAWLHGLTNTQVTFIHYKGGGPLYVDLVAGRVSVAPGTFLMGLQFVKSGKLRPIANLGLERSPSLPDLRTAIEQGLPGYEYPSWSGYLAPARTPAAIVEKLNAEFVKAGRAPDVRQKLEDQGAVPVASTAEQFRQTIVTEVTRWRKVVLDNDLKVDP